VEGHVDSAGDGNGLTMVLVDRPGVEVEDVGDHPHLTARVRDGLAHVAGFQPGQFLAVLLDEHRQAT
jgi:hypothetical protein